MTNGNGSGHRRMEADITIEHIELEAVFLACLVSLLQVTKQHDLSEVEADAITFSCSTIDKAVAALVGELADEWKAGVVRCVRDNGAGQEVKKD